MIIIAGTITMDPAKVDTAMAAAASVVAATRVEPGNLDYVFTVDPTTPGVLRVFERWESEEAIAAHFGAPHMAEFTAAMGEFGITGTDLLKYQVSDFGPLF